jgi:hypothetical protein
MNRVGIRESGQDKIVTLTLTSAVPLLPNASFQLTSLSNMTLHLPLNNYTCPLFELTEVACHSKSENLRPRGRKDDRHLWPVTNAAGSISNAMVLRLSAHAVPPLPPPALTYLLDEASRADKNSTRMAQLARGSIALVRLHHPLQRHRRLFVKHTGICIFQAEQMHLSTRQTQPRRTRVSYSLLQRGPIS